MIRGVLFDMDGLMFDTERLSTEGWLQAAEELHAPLTKEFVLRFKGTNIQTSRRMFREAFGDAVDYDACRSIRTAYIHRVLREQGVPVKPGLQQLLAYLREQQIPAAVATSTQEDLARQYVADAGLTDYFSAFAFGSEVAHGKPAPDIFLLAAKRLGVPIAQCLVLEDSTVGIEAAQAAHAQLAAIPDQIDLTGRLPKEAVCFPSLYEVIDFIEQANQ